MIVSNDSVLMDDLGNGVPENLKGDSSKVCFSCFLLLVLMISQNKNIFNHMPALAPPRVTDLRDELDRYLSSDVEHVTDAIAWWHEHRGSFPRVSQMALDYLTIPGTSYVVSFH